MDGRSILDKMNELDNRVRALEDIIGCLPPASPPLEPLRAIETRVRHIRPDDGYESPQCGGSDGVSAHSYNIPAHPNDIGYTQEEIRVLETLTRAGRPLSVSDMSADIGSELSQACVTGTVQALERSKVICKAGRRRNPRTRKVVPLYAIGSN